MNTTRRFTQSLLLAALCSSFFSPTPARAESCMNDSLMMVDEYVECECDCLEDVQIKPKKKTAKRAAHAAKRSFNRVAHHANLKRTVANETVRQNIARVPQTISGTSAAKSVSQQVVKPVAPTVQQVARQAAMRVVAETVRQADNFANLQKEIERLKTLAHHSAPSEKNPHRI